MSVCKFISDRELQTFIPQVYQHDILDIDYDKLSAVGVKMITFDVDDTINSMANKLLHFKPKKEVVELFEELHNKGFTVVLVSNASEENVKRAANHIKVDGYISRAKKPFGDGFERAVSEFGGGLQKNQVAHIGNSMRKDVKGANEFGCISCLVRDMGMLTKVGLELENAVGKNEGEEIREELKERKLWRQHHKRKKGDQYYQLGETPEYKRHSER